MLNATLRTGVLAVTEFSVPGRQEAGWDPQSVSVRSVAPIKWQVAVMHQVRLLMQNHSKTLRTARNITAANTVWLCCLSPEQTELFTSPLNCSASYHHYFCGICKYRANNVFKCIIFTRTVKYDWTSNINYYLNTCFNNITSTSTQCTQ